MRRLSVYICLMSMCAVAGAQTGISGDIGEVEFSTDNNPYIVEQDIIIPKGQKVTIPQGVVFLFHPFTGIRVEGRLDVMGSEENMVIFTSINDKAFNPQSEVLPNPFDWNGIYVAQDADGAHMNHFSLKFSVYGVKSQCNSIIIQNAIFQKNGQFHFTVNEQIKPVVDDIPYHYKDPKAETTALSPQDHNTGTKKPVEKPPLPPVVDPVTEKKGDTNNNIIRYTSLGAGAAGGVVAAVLAIKMNQHKNRMNEINSSGKNLDEWKPEYDKWAEARAGTVVSGIIGALGAVGFAVTFAF